MGNVCIEHKLTDCMIWQFNMPMGHMVNQNGEPMWVRECAKLHASPGVSYIDIMNEYYSKNSGFMETITVAYHRYLISMTHAGFYSTAIRVPQRVEDAPQTDHQAMERLAKELVASRDYEAAGGYLNKNHKYRDYWPKD